MSAPRNRGTDSSGRTIWATDYEWSWWEGVVYELGFRPTITQGPWQRRNGGGAPDSAGYHDYGGTFDLRVRDLSPTQQARVIRVIRNNGAPGWIRDRVHGGFADPHIHLVLASAPNLSVGARWQVAEYVAGRDGLASRGKDYHPRPTPAIPPVQKRFLMPTADEIAKAVRSEIDAALAGLPEAVWGHRIATVAPEKREDVKASRLLAETHRWRGDDRPTTTKEVAP